MGGPENQSTENSWANYVLGASWLVPVGVILRAVCQWLVIVVIAYFGSVGDVGKLTASLALTGVFFVFLSFGMRNVYLTHSDRLPIRWYLRARYLLLSLAAVVSISLAALLGSYELQIVALVCGTKFVEATADMLFVADQENGRQGLVGLVMIILGLGSVLGFTIGYVSMRSIVVGQVVWLGVNVFTATVYYVYVRRHYADKYFGEVLKWPKTVMSAGFNSGIAQATATAQVSVPVLLLNQFAGSTEVGTFSLLFYFVTIFNLTASGFQQQALPGLVLASQKSKKWTRYNAILVGGSLLIGLCAAVAGPFLMGSLYGGVQVSNGAFIAVALAIAANGWSLGSGARLLVAQRYRVQMLSGISGTVVTLIYCLVVGSSLSVQHAVISVAAGYFIRGLINSVTIAGSNWAGSKRVAPSRPADQFAAKSGSSEHDDYLRN